MAIQLQERDRKILEHIARYRLSVKEALQQTPIFQGESEEMVKQVMARLRRGGYVRSAPLYEQRHYWHLTVRGCHELLEHERLGKPLREEAKRRAFATLSFCCCKYAERTRLTSKEFKAKFAEFYLPGDRIEYYLDRERGFPRLGYIRVDSRGLRGRWTRIISQLHQDIHKRADRPGFRDLILHGRFVMAVLTGTPDKAERLSELIQEKGFPPEVEIKCHVVPELIPLGDPQPQ